MTPHTAKLTLITFLSGALIALAPTATSAAPSPVFVANNGCRGHAVRPSNIILACGDGEVWATNLRYGSSYGGRTAWASGRLHYVVCQPNCAQGTVRSAATQIKLTEIVRCSGRRYYGVATIVKPAFRSGRWFIRPLGC